MQISKQNIPFIIVPLILVFDQVLKIWVKTNMVLGESSPVLGDWFILHFTENYGMAFGIQFAGELGKIILSIFRIGAVVFIVWYLHRLIQKNSTKLLIASISLILAGAIGNIIDSAFYGMIFSDSYYRTAEFLPEGGGYARFLHGKVVDMLYFPIIDTTLPDWFPLKGGERFIFFKPVFNIADAAITTGAMMLIFFHKRLFPQHSKKQEKDTNKA